MRSPIRTYGNRKWITICAAGLAIVAIVLFTVVLCVHDYSASCHGLKYFNFANKKYFEITDTASDDFTDIIKSGEYKNYDNIYRFECPTTDGSRAFNIGFDTLVYNASEWGYNSGRNLIFECDETLSEKSVRCEVYVCNQIKNFTADDYGKCNILRTDENNYFPPTGSSASGIALPRDYFYSAVHFEQNVTYREIKKVTWSNDKTVTYELIDSYEVEPTYSIVFGTTVPLGNKSSVSGHPSGYGLSDGDPYPYYDVMFVVYCSPDIEVIGSDSKTWNEDALGV